MSEGLEYLPESLRAGGQGSYAASDEAESAHAYLRTVSASASSYGGADAFVNAVNETRDTQARGVNHAVEGRDDLGDSGYQAAAIGEDTDAASHAAVTAAGTTGELGQRIADGI
ncbi:hypothetical protein FH609_009570 [Streptomyces sp. 3MP-14]|uniref:ESX-1 secretion-associated protein n=1 Tax=Streptomyces mimosae TaxID=2586635 RepID=A0A5N6AGU0_9ACTN|nr:MULTISPECIES: hypothetical protein [Streptomyces]KAB8167881.1 hypothetical protein FH607_007850 [Streptomyces mimosae]KAB8177471.1 hypothetical protein FH609_009570 [Streptomyces sp. 3MP-14]